MGTRVFIFVRSIFALIGLFAMAWTAHAQVLIIYGAASNPAYAQDVVTELQAANLNLGPITIYNAGGSNPVPSLATLQQYQAVLAFSDSGGFSDPVGLGNNLAAYVNGGGGVVEAVFANGSIPITGAWESGGYSPFNPGNQSEDTPLTLGTILEPNSPILAGVTSFSGGTSSYYSTGSLTSNAVVVADWSNGVPLIVLSPGFDGRIVSLNFYPPSSNARSDFWDATTDGGLILANSLDFVAVPEPSTWTLLGLGAMLLGIRYRRRLLRRPV